MKRGARIAAWSLVAVAALTLAGCDELLNLGKSKEDLARERVEFILSTVKRAGGTTSDELQKAICRWWNDKIYISNLGEFEMAMEQFEDWQRQAGMFPRPESYEILEFREEEGSDAMLVLVKINGGYRWMVVPPKQPISWARGE